MNPRDDYILYRAVMQMFGKIPKGTKYEDLPYQLTRDGYASIRAHHGPVAIKLPKEIVGGRISFSAYLHETIDDTIQKLIAFNSRITFFKAKGYKLTESKPRDSYWYCQFSFPLITNKYITQACRDVKQLVDYEQEGAT